MNRIYKVTTLTLLTLPGVFLTSCRDTLDTKPMEFYTEEQVWSSRPATEAFINATYNNVLSMMNFSTTGMGYAGSGTCISWESRTPNSVKASQAMEGIDRFTTEQSLSRAGKWGLADMKALRRTNLIIEQVNANASLTPSEKVELSAHGYLLRGMIFFGQARLVGRFVPIRQVLSSTDTIVAKMPMTKDLSESYRLIIEDLRKAYEGLPAVSKSGIANKWAAGVLLSRAALQGYAYTMDPALLDIAEKSAQEVIDQSGRSVSPSLGIHNEMDRFNTEILWGYYRLATNSMIVNFEEISRTIPNLSNDNVKASDPSQVFDNPKQFQLPAIHFPTQDLVDQYLAIDEKSGKALPWYETSQYRDNVDELDPATITHEGQIDAFERSNGQLRRMPTPQDFKQTNSNYPNFVRFGRLKSGSEVKDISKLIYSNRDRRLAATVVYDQSEWQDEHITTNLNGNAAQGVSSKEEGGQWNTNTGYYWRKSSIEKCEPNASFMTKVPMHYNIVRLSEAYLNLAEAKLLKGNIPAAVEALNVTRTVRGGLPPSQASTKEEAWADYIRERNCELTNEGGDLYFSYLRWGKYGGPANHGRRPGDIVYDLDRPVYKITIDRARKTFVINQMTLLNAAQRKFTTKRYLLPINQDFLNVRESYGLDHTQNPEW